MMSSHILFFDRRFLSADDNNAGGPVITDSTGMAVLHKILHHDGSSKNSEADYNVAFADAWSLPEHNNNVIDEPPLSSQIIQPYKLEDTINESKIFNSAYTILIYNN